MKITKYKMVDGKLVPVLKIDNKIPKDTKLKAAFNKYLKLVKQYKDLNLKAKDLAFCTQKIYLNNNWFQVNLWYQNLEKLDSVKLSLNNIISALKNIMKSFSQKLDKADYESRKRIFIYNLKACEIDLKRYYEIITQTENMKSRFNTTPTNQR